MKKIVCCFTLLFIVLGCEQDNPDVKPKPEKTLTNSIGMKLVYIRPGEFMMGTPSKESLRVVDEEPRHRVKLSEGFYMGVTEVTQAQYRAITGTSPSRFNGEDNPVETVSWNEAVEFCKKLSEREGKTYRLPTEAEWEYACRAGTTTPFYTGETINTSQANYNGDYVYGNGTKGVFRDRTISVGSFPPNAFGLYDMHGNVWEWCQDWYGEDYYKTSPVLNPQGPSSGKYRVLRGGCWLLSPIHCRSVRRHRAAPGNRSTAENGFRILLDLNDPYVQATPDSENQNAQPTPDNENQNAQQDKSIADGTKHQETPMDVPVKEKPTPASRVQKTLTNSIGMKLVCIQPGEFMMGSPSDELLRKSNEGPQHRVKITNGFYIGSTEVTQAQYAAIMETNPSHFKGEDNPVETVSWDNAVEFCRKLSEMEGKKYRLPTEAEWEYACRAGTTPPFYTGETINTSQANYNGREVYGNGTKGVFRRRTIAVGSFPPNAFGLYDMHGNVWEWCRDWYASNYYSTSPAADPQGPSTGDHRVLRGGCWIVFPRGCRSAVRDWNTPVNRLSSNGFRILLE